MVTGYHVQCICHDIPSEKGTHPRNASRVVTLRDDTSHGCIVDDRLMGFHFKMVLAFYLLSFHRQCKRNEMLPYLATSLHTLSHARSPLPSNGLLVMPRPHAMTGTKGLWSYSLASPLRFRYETHQILCVHNTVYAVNFPSTLKRFKALTCYEETLKA